MSSTTPRSIRECKHHGETEFRLSGNRWGCAQCNRENARRFYHDHSYLDRLHERGICQPISENKGCAKYLGVYIVERVLAHVFKHVQRMPIDNPGYDFICGKGMKVDAKSSCLRHDRRCRSTHWNFGIKRNPIAEYFILVAFDDRAHLNPLHIWLIPGHLLRHFMSLTITNNEQGIAKWQEYERPLDKVVVCCDTMRS